MKYIAFVLTYAALFLPSNAIAQSNEKTTKPPSYISLSIGYYDILDSDTAIDFRAEYRPNKTFLLDNLKPFAALEITSQGSTWAGIGILYDMQLSEKLYLTTSFAPGLYNQGGGDINLGHIIEFRTQLELSYKFENNYRIGAGFSHMSNSSLDSRNPGTEVLSLYWHIPIN